MPVTVEVYGSQRMREVGRQLRAAGLEGQGLRRELLATMRTTAKPLLEDTKNAAREELPQAGGLNNWTAASKMSVRNRLSGRGAGVRLVAGKGNSNLRRLDKGTARHPVFGNRNVWATNPVKPGWWTDTLRQSAPKVQLAILTAMRVTVDKIGR